MPRLMTAVITPLIAVLLFPLIAFAALTGNGNTCTPQKNTTWDDEQLTNAATIIKVGRSKSIPLWGQVIAVAVAMQESHLRNPPDGDADSIGLFQQRPSQGWGTPTQLSSPAYQAGRFFDTLTTVPAWQSLPLTVAAQDVQKSANPDAYAHWTDDALTLVTQTSAIGPASLPGQGAAGPDCQDDEGDGLPDTPFTLPPNYALPPEATPAAADAITWALQQLGTPYSYGGDCTAARSGDPTHQCDCSSLVQQAYRAADIPLPRTTSEQVHTGTAVPVTALRPGDLIFIPGREGTLAAPRHVGIYLGHGLLIHAPHTGAQVRLAPLTTWSLIAAIRRVT
jgi:cell wall-associated NlpC family hydrolase